jgi:hypothetical protein
MTRKLDATRRLFIRLAAASLGGLGFSGCGGGGGARAEELSEGPGPAPAPAPSPSPAPAPPPSATGHVIDAGPTDYLAKLAQLKPGDTLRLAPGHYGVDAQGNDTGSVPGLPIFNLNGTAQAPIVITGPDAGPRPVLLGRSSHNTIRLSNASHIVIRRLEVDGRDRGGFGLAAQGPVHHITIEDNHFHGLGSDQQVVAISSTGQPTWGWVVRGNLIEGAGTGMYLGNSNGDSPFVDGLIERNVVRDTIGYCIQLKHQVAWGSVPADMPAGPTVTIIRHNVFTKSANSSTGSNARPCLLVGDQPPSGPGSGNGVAIYGNFFYRNPTESLFQGEGNIGFYGNLLVTSGTAVRVQPHNGQVREVRIFHNTVVAGGSGIVVNGGTSSFTKRVLANAVFAGGASVSSSGTGVSGADNVTDLQVNAPAYLNSPLADLGELDLFPRTGALRRAASDLAGLEGYPDWDRDFNGSLRDASFRGAYSGEGVNPGWRLALSTKP